MEVGGAQNKSLARAIKWYDGMAGRWPRKKAVGVARCEVVCVVLRGVEADVGVGDEVDWGRFVEIVVGFVVAESEESHGIL